MLTAVCWNVIRLCVRLQIRSCGAQVALAERTAGAGAAANNRQRRSTASTASSHEAEALRARGELLQRDLVEATLLADDDRQTAAAGSESDESNGPLLSGLASASAAASALPPALEHSGVSLYHSLFSKRVCVLKQLLQLTRADIAHTVVQSRQGRLPAVRPDAAISSAAVRWATIGSVSSSISPPTAIPPLLRQRYAATRTTCCHTQKRASSICVS